MGFPLFCFIRMFVIYEQNVCVFSEKSICQKCINIQNNVDFIGKYAIIDVYLMNIMQEYTTKG